MYFEDEHPDAIQKIKDIIDPETILESAGNMRNIASLILYKGTKELTRTEFDKQDNLNAVASRVISDIKDHPEADNLTLVYVDDLPNSTRTIYIDNFKSLDIDSLEQEIYEKLDDE
jgi:hypothetical protein